MILMVDSFPNPNLPAHDRTARTHAPTPPRGSDRSRGRDQMGGHKKQVAQLKKVVAMETLANRVEVGRCDRGGDQATQCTRWLAVDVFKHKSVDGCQGLRTPTTPLSLLARDGSDLLLGPHTAAL